MVEQGHHLPRVVDLCRDAGAEERQPNDERERVKRKSEREPTRGRKEERVAQNERGRGSWSSDACAPSTLS